MLPAALELATLIAIAPRMDRKLKIRSLLMGETAEFDLDEPEPRPRKDWSDYVHGVVIVLKGAGHRVDGADLLIASDVPVGAGLSSSAALEVAVGYALLRTAGQAIDLTELALLCQRAENGFVGMRCGIMDQFIACRGAAGRALLLDCRSLDWRLVPIDPYARLVICNTMVHHEHAAGEYNLRRRDCEAGVARLSAELPGITALRDVTQPKRRRSACVHSRASRQSGRRRVTRPRRRARRLPSGRRRRRRPHGVAPAPRPVPTRRRR